MWKFWGGSTRPQTNGLWHSEAFKQYEPVLALTQVLLPQCAQWARGCSQLPHGTEQFLDSTLPAKYNRMLPSTPKHSFSNYMPEKDVMMTLSLVADIYSCFIACRKSKFSRKNFHIIIGSLLVFSYQWKWYGKCSWSKHGAWKDDLLQASISLLFVVWFVITHTEVKHLLPHLCYIPYRNINLSRHSQSISEKESHSLCFKSLGWWGTWTILHFVSREL